MKRARILADPSVTSAIAVLEEKLLDMEFEHTITARTVRSVPRKRKAVGLAAVPAAE
jgi:hypothetical protein